MTPLSFSANNLKGKFLDFIINIRKPADRIMRARHFPIDKARFSFNSAWKGDLYFMLYGFPKSYIDDFNFIISKAPFHGDIVDVGANIGVYSIYLAYATSKKVHAFEPIQATSLKLQQNVRLNDIDVATYCMAAGSKDEVREIMVRRNINEDSGQSSFGVVPADDFFKISVPVVKLDSVLKGRIGFIKIDVEGHEFEVIKGAKRIIQEHKPKIYFEVSKSNFGSYEEAEKQFSGLLKGYDIYFIHKGKGIPIKEALRKGIVMDGNWYAEYIVK